MIPAGKEDSPMSSSATVRFRVYGIVQGVGFRPTVDRHARTAVRIQFLHIGQCAQLVLHHLHGLQLHFMRRRTRIYQHHRCLFHSHGGVFQFRHI